MAESYIDPAVARALERLEARLQPWYDQWQVVKDIRFIAANQSLDVAHGMERIPDGFAVIVADGPVYAAPGKVWTEDVAFLQTSGSDVRADVVFYTLREN